MNQSANTPDFNHMLRTFARIGCLSFGGPAGQIALMHKELVEDRKWVSEDDYLHALNFCHLLPGPEAQQLATWVGWKLHGTKGAIAAGLLFVIPGALVMLGLSVLYALTANLAWFSALFLGIKAAVLAIVVQALLRIGGRSLKSPFQRTVAVAAFFALFLFSLPFPLVVLGACLLGMAVAATRPGWLNLKSALASPLPPRPPIGSTIKTILTWLLVWAAPMTLVLTTLGGEHALWKIGVFFSQLAVVTFGGAYAVLAYMAQEAVQSHGWMQPHEMADALGLAETTPGPLILVTQHVGFLAAYRAPEPFSPMVAGLIGAGLTSWVTFAPCFLWIMTFAPWIERLQHAHRLKGGLAAVTAAVVGVIANLSLWFAMHVLFGTVEKKQIGPFRFEVAEWASIDLHALLLTAMAAALLFGLRWSVFRTLALAALGGLILSRL